MIYRLVYSQTSRAQIRTLHSAIKPIVRERLQKLQENPLLGKALEKRLSGYFSLRARRFRIIYKVAYEHHLIQIHYVGRRKDIYELFEELLTGE
jgi:mRNA-degrading endonuclease RelE of RelBE toxin-antitoxin system